MGKSLGDDLVWNDKIQYVARLHQTMCAVSVLEQWWVTCSISGYCCQSSCPSRAHFVFSSQNGSCTRTFWRHLECTRSAYRHGAMVNPKGRNANRKCVDFMVGNLGLGIFQVPRGKQRVYCSEGDAFLRVSVLCVPLQPCVFVQIWIKRWSLVRDTFRFQQVNYFCYFSLTLNR